MPDWTKKKKKKCPSCTFGISIFKRKRTARVRAEPETSLLFSETSVR